MPKRLLPLEGEEILLRCIHSVQMGFYRIFGLSATISNIRPECFSFSLPLLQFQKRFLTSFQKIVLQDEKRTVCIANRS